MKFDFETLFGYYQQVYFKKRFCMRNVDLICISNVMYLKFAQMF